MNTKLYILSLLILLLVAANAAAQKSTPRIASIEILNDKAVSLPDPAYPPAARAVQASGAVNVQVTIDENGDVISAAAVSGHPLLRAASVAAARQAKFAPVTIDGKTVKVTGVIVYIFMTPEQWQYIGETLGDAEIEIANSDDLQNAADYLKSVYPEISLSIETIAENYRKDEQAARFQPDAVYEATRQILTKLSKNARNEWFFELGLAIGRIKANFFDETILRVNLSRIKELAAFYPATENRGLEDEVWSDDLVELSAMAERQYFSRKDKLRVKKLAESF